MKNSVKIWKYIVWLFLAVCLTLICRTGSGKKALAASWLTLSGNNNDIQSIVISPDRIIITGTHAKSGSRKHYRTVGYYLTLERYDLESRFTRNGNEQIRRVRLPVRVYDDFDYSTSLIQTTYTIEREDFMRAAAELSLKPEEIAGGSAKVYLHNIFITREYLDDTYTKSAVTCGSDEIFGYQEMLEAPVKYRLGFSQWGRTTQMILPYYYNLEFTLTAMGLYDLEVICEDENRNPIGETELLRRAGAAGGEFRYEDIKTELVYGDTVYTYARKWYLTYLDRKDQKEKQLTQGNGSRIGIHEMPDALSASLHLCYEREEPDEGPTEEDHVNILEKKINDPGAEGRIKAMDPGSERYLVTERIPAGEQVYAMAESDEYLLGYRLIRHTGTKTYQVRVNKDYILRWQGAGKGEILTETVTVSRVVSVSRAYSYWEAAEFELYGLDGAEIENPAVNEGKILLASAGEEQVSLSAQAVHSGREDYYLTAPELTVTLPSETITSESMDRPNPGDISTGEADRYIGPIRVRNDRIIVNGRTVLSDEFCNTRTKDPDMSALSELISGGRRQMYKGNIGLKKEIANQSFPSDGIIIYRKLASLSSGRDTISYPIYDLNEIRIHTPVVCAGILKGIGQAAVQAEFIEEDAVQLILDPDASFASFLVKVSNTGMHLEDRGYGSRDYADYLLRKNGMPDNEVSFPFDVFRLSRDVGEPEFIPANTWIIIGNGEEKFAPAVWTREGIYTVRFRSVAANGAGKEARAEASANRSQEYYAASDEVKVQLSGRLYGFTVYDISDYPAWQNVFRAENSLKLKKDLDYPDGTRIEALNRDYRKYAYVYAPGTTNQYGQATGRSVRYTLPVFYGSHPYILEAGVLKPGYELRFYVETTGDGYLDNAMLDMRPEFFFVKKGTGERIPADLYYQERTGKESRGLIQVGGAYDRINIKSTSVKDEYLAIPAGELKITAEMRNESLSDMQSRVFGLFSFGRIRLPYGMRTYVNLAGGSESAAGTGQDTVFDGIGRNEVIRAVQRWYGEYYLPGNVKAVRKGTDVKGYAARNGIDWSEEFWLTDGYLIVNLTIRREISDRPELTLLYDNSSNGGADMWKTESAALKAADESGNLIPLCGGDVFLFRMDESIADDYPVSGVY